ncbi:unnamed protein product, partial [Polarella glacialis]
AQQRSLGCTPGDADPHPAIHASTQLSPGELNGSRAVSLERAIAELKAKLPRRAVLVGQEPEGDFGWMQLTQGVDFRETLNLAEVLRSFIQVHIRVFTNSQGMVFSLRHQARVLLGKDASKGVHDPSWDAKVSVELYRKASEASEKELAALRDKLTSKEFWPPKHSLARECGYQIDGVCLSMYGADHCICGKPTVTPNIKKR